MSMLWTKTTQAKDRAPQPGAPVRTLLLNRDFYFHGGVAQAFLNLVRNHDPRRVLLSAASFMVPSPEMTHEFADREIPFHQLTESYSQSIRSIRRLIRQRGTQVVVCGTFKAFVAASIATAGTPCRVVYWVQAIPFMDTFPKKQVFHLLARRKTLVFISEAVRDKHLYSWHRGQSTVVLHGIPDRLETVVRANPDLRETIGASPEALVVGYVAEFVGWKDHRSAILAFNALLEELPDAHLVLIGKGPTMEPCQLLAQSLNIEERVHFLGPRSDVQALLSQLDIYVHPANGEGFGLAIAEAMLMKVPVVVANAGAIPEFVHHGETGLLFPPHDIDALAEQLRVLARDTTLRDRLGFAGRAYCLQEFSLVRFADQMSEIIEGEAHARNRPMQ